MRPGITVQHTSLPQRRLGLVRCDITALVTAISKEHWPEGTSEGDVVEGRYDRSHDFWEDALRPRLTPLATKAGIAFFENGGELLHVFAVCLESLHQLAAPSVEDGPLARLFERLRTEDDIGLLIAPDAAGLPTTVRPGHEVHSEGEPLWNHLLHHCRQMSNRFLVMDPPRGLHEDALLRWIHRFSLESPETRSYGALYYPWLQHGDERAPPSGAMAGLYARTEREHEPFGVLWPPANVPVRGVTHTEVDLDWREIADLVEHHVNPILVQAGRGVIVWGARTLSRDPAFIHINSRRIVSMVSDQLRRDNEWAVFEHNDASTWKVIERDVGVRLEEFWRAGLIAGDTQQGEYEVKCDAETNPRSEQETGRLNVQVFLRPIGTTEHITIDLRLGSHTT
ncbi:MAG: phage tail sheath family protein [Deltaproteobacteria bacterium]|nr:phage tail sheath family protein [Deltaproteobacteria bacterium]